MNGFSYAQTPLAQFVFGQRSLGSALQCLGNPSAKCAALAFGEKLRLVFDLSGPVRYKTFTLSAPERLIIDLSGASLSGDFSQLPLADTAIRSIRAGHLVKAIPGSFSI
jgi:hypothetical protein